MTLISVIIPAHNRQQHVARAILSVREQTYRELEVIVVDDGSQDATRAIIEQQTREDPRVRLLVHAEQRGAQAARNTGIRAAQGTWIALLDSDDYWLEDSLEVRWQLAVARGPVVVHSDAYRFYPGGTEPQPWSLPPLEGDVYKQLLARPGPMFQSMLLPREALERIGYLDPAIISYQEWDTAIRLAEKYPFAFLARPTFVYDCRHTNTISKNPLRTAWGYEQVVRKHRWPILRRLGRHALAEHFSTAAGHYREANHTARSRILLAKASLLRPWSSATYELFGALVGEGRHRELWRRLRRRFLGRKDSLTPVPAERRA